VPGRHISGVVGFFADGARLVFNPEIAAWIDLSAARGPTGFPCAPLRANQDDDGLAGP